MSIQNAIDEIIGKLKKAQLPGCKSETIWDLLVDQVGSNGKLEEGLIESIKSEVTAWLDSLSEDIVWNLYDQTELPYNDAAESDISLIRDDIIDEILNRVIDKADDSFEYSDAFSEETVYDDIIDSDEEELLNFDDDEDELDDDDIYFDDDDDDRYR
jgi:hypothetical protein